LSGAEWLNLEADLEPGLAACLAHMLEPLAELLAPLVASLRVEVVSHRRGGADPNEKPCEPGFHHHNKETARTDRCTCFDYVGVAGRYLRWRYRMNLTTLVVDLVIILVIAAIAISVARAWRARPARAHLTSLPPEARARYLAAWDRVEKRFLEAPQEAVQEADSLMLAMLGERGHPLGHDRLPRRLRDARRKLAEGQRRNRTEYLRRALLDYRAVFGEMIGPEQVQLVAEGRRETA
jgi:hypothetical protein